jgi:hypothetical protein
MITDDTNNDTINLILPASAILSDQEVDTTPPSLVNDSTLMAVRLLTATITSNLLQFTDNSSSDAEEIYTVTTAPHDGILLLNGSPTSLFTQAEIDSGEVSYQSLTNGGSDGFGFTVSDAAGNLTADQQFHVGIKSSGPVLFGSQFEFFVDSPLNAVYTLTGADLPAAVPGAFNLEIVISPTQTAYPLPPGYQGVATFPGVTVMQLDLLAGNVNVVDTRLAAVITAGPGNGSIGGGDDDTITGGTGTRWTA